MNEYELREQVNKMKTVLRYLEAILKSQEETRKELQEIKYKLTASAKKVESKNA